MPVSAAGPSSSSLVVTRRGETGWLSASASAAAARRRSATSWAWWVRAVTRSPTTSRPWRYGTHQGASRPRTSPVLVRAAFPVATRGHDLAGAAVEGDQGGQLVERLPDRPHQQEAHDSQQRAQPEPEHLPWERPAAGVDQQRVEGGPALLVVGVPPGQRCAAHAAVGGLDVEHDCRGHHDGLVTGGRGPPPEVDVVAEDSQLVVEAAEFLEHRATDQHAGGVDGEHAAYVVVLALVVLAALEARLAPSGAGDGDAHLEQAAQRWPLAQLGAEHVGRRVRGSRGEQLGQRVRSGVGVVVEQPDPLGVGGRVQALADGGRERGGRRDPEDGVGDVVEKVGAGVLAAGVDADDAVRHPALRLQPRQHRRQPPGSVVADDERDDAPCWSRVHGRQP